METALKQSVDSLPIDAWHQLASWLLVDPAQGVIKSVTDPEAVKAIQSVSDLHDRCSSGEIVSPKEWKTAYEDVASLANAAAEEALSASLNGKDPAASGAAHIASSALTAAVWSSHVGYDAALGGSDATKPSMAIDALSHAASDAVFLKGGVQEADVRDATDAAISDKLATLTA